MQWENKMNIGEQQQKVKGSQKEDRKPRERQQEGKTNILEI